MDEPPPDEPVPPQPPILLPASDLPPMSEAPVVLQPAHPSWSLSPSVVVAGGALLVALGVGFVFFRFDTILFLVSAMIVPPMIVLPLLAYAGERATIVRPIVIVCWLFMAGLGAFASYGSAASATESSTTKALAAAGVGIGVLFGCLCFVPRVRETAARGLPIDSQSFVHAAALASIVSLTTICFVPLVVLGGPPALDDTSTEQMTKQIEQLPSGLLLRMTCYIYFWAIAAIPCLVGFPVARKLPSAIKRLGFVAPSVGQVIGAVIAACVLAVAMTGVDFGIGQLWSAMGWPRTDAQKFDELMAYAKSPIGAIVIAVSAGLSEELFFRGVLQPRLGLLLANLCFASVHAFQYNWDALTSVFLIGLLLGAIRNKYNTTTAAIVHGTYDYLLLLASYYEFDPTKWFGG